MRDVLTSVLEHRLTDHIREQLGASYSPSASSSVNPDPDALVETYLNVTGDPTTIAQLSQIVVDDVADLRQNGPSTAGVRRRDRRAHTDRTRTSTTSRSATCS
jgi:zinc protease